MMEMLQFCHIFQEWTLAVDGVVLATSTITGYQQEWDI